MNDIDRLEERIATLEKVFLKENERLESKIKALEYLQRKQNGFDTHYFPILTYSRN